jgi:uncharacterized protein
MDQNKKYLSHTWVDPRLISGPSKINGTGIITTKCIKAGEVLIIWGGVKIPTKNLDLKKYHEQTLVLINNDFYLGLPIEDTSRCIEEYLNHSCDSNTWLTDEVTMVARRDIVSNEEITLDHALWDMDTQWDYLSEEVKKECNCGSPYCRIHLTPDDWKIHEVQSRYRGHFSPYVQKHITDLKHSQ